MSVEETLQIALAHHKAGQLDQAAQLYREILSQRPDHPDALQLLGALAGQSGRFQEAVDLISRAIEVNPKVAELHHNLGLNLASLNRVDDAIAAYRKALQLRPDYPKALHNLAAAQNKRGETDAAISLCRRAVALQPSYVEALCTLGTMLLNKGDFETAAATYRQAVSHQPDSHQAWFNLGVALQKMTDLDGALAAYEQAIKYKPDWTEALTNLGVIHKMAGRLDDAMRCYQQAMDSQPSNTVAHSNLIYLLEFHPGATPAQIWEHQLSYERRHALPLRSLIRPHVNDRSPDRRLKIGYVSPDFRHHVVGVNLLPLFREHDHTQFEIVCYSSVESPDSMTQRLKSFTDGWRDIARRDDQAAADLIRSDGVDILVDLTLHMSDNRLLLMARKPAPVQVCYLGYCGTTGLSAIDYRLSDPYMDPPNRALGTNSRNYSEQTLRLASSYWCYQRPDPAPAIAPPPVLKAGYITFGCLNNFSKVSPAALNAWADVLAAVPNSRLIIHCLPGKHQKQALEHFTKKGIAPERVQSVSRQPFWQYLQTFHKIDVALDPFPYGGGITTCDGLWMGVPIVTLAADTPVGRGGMSILNNIGCPQWVAHTPADYVRIAADLAADPTKLADLRIRMRERMLTSPLMDAKRFARDIESAYRTMWRTWCGIPR